MKSKVQIKMRKIKIYFLILIIALILTASFSTSAQTKRTAPEYVITFNSFGPVKAGMTVSRAFDALGVKLTTVERGSCRYYEAKGRFKDVGFMVNDGTIARFDVSERGRKIRTEAALRDLLQEYTLTTPKVLEKSNELQAIENELAAILLN